MPQQRTVAIGLASVWGVCATWIFWWLFSPVCCGILFSASEPAVKALLRNGWTAEQIESYLNGVTTVLPALFYGLIFGMPLGFLAGRSVIVTWMAFVVTFLLALAGRMLLAQYSINGVLKNLVSSIYLLTFLATLLFAVVARRGRSAYVSRRAAA